MPWSQCGHKYSWPPQALLMPSEFGGHEVGERWAQGGTRFGCYPGLTGGLAGGEAVASDFMQMRWKKSIQVDAHAFAVHHCVLCIPGKKWHAGIIWQLLAKNIFLLLLPVLSACYRTPHACSCRIKPTSWCQLQGGKIFYIKAGFVLLSSFPVIFLRRQQHLGLDSNSTWLVISRSRK